MTDMEKASTRINKPMTAAEKHNQNLCGCSKVSNPENCIFQPFLDGWNYTTDVGNSQKRGEIFTPRYIVDKMIVTSGILPASIVENLNYKIGTTPTSITKEEATQLITNRINEPAVGTGNFTATVLWHKLELAAELATTNKTLNIETYHLLITKAIASTYGYDIDSGNLQTTKWRLLRQGQIDSPQTREYWTKYITKSIYSEKINKKSIEKQVSDSLIAAQKNWSKIETDGGVIDTLYRKHTKQKPSNYLTELWNTILNENFILFNGISEQDTITDSFTVPGWSNIIWKWWEFEPSMRKIVSSYKEVSLAAQIRSTIIQRLEENLSDLEKNLTGDPTTNTKIRKEYKAKKEALKREEAALEKAQQITTKRN